jgi:predicted Zn-dependent peptidase
MADRTALGEFRFQKSTLKNGLDVVIRRQSELPLVAINLWYHVGSKNEQRNQRGFAHLFEHLMFEGSEHYPGDFFQHLQRLGANINGSTSSDRTNYFVDLPSAHVELALAMESDRMAHLLGSLTESKLSVQKNVVKNEYRQNYPNRPYGMVWQLVAEALYPPQHPYSWLTIGVMEDIDSATLADVSAFFSRYYVPANASLAIVGDLEVEEALALSERFFAPIAGGTGAIRPWVPAVELMDTREIELHDRVELDRLYLVWPTVPHFHPDDASLLLLSDVLGRGKASRLYRALVIEQQIAQDVTAYQAGRELAGSFGIIVTLRPAQSMSEARDLIEAELRAVAVRPVATEELQRVQNMKVASFCFALEQMGGFGGVADRLNAYNVFQGDPALITSDLERFRAVTPVVLQEVAGRYLDGRPRISLSVDGRSTDISIASLDRAVPPRSSAPAVYRPPRPEVTTLPCGIPLWFFPRRDLPTVAGSIIVKGGADLQHEGQEGLANLTLSMLEEGTISRTAAEIALAAESIGASISASCGWDGSWVSFKCVKSDLDTCLDLAADILLYPTFPDTEWRRVRGQSLAALKAERDSAESRAYRAFLKALYSHGHPYRFPIAGTEPSVETLTHGDLMEFHRRSLVPSFATVVVAGDAEPEALAGLLDGRLSSWTGASDFSSAIEHPPDASHPRVLLVNRPGAPQAVLRVGHLGVSRTDPAFERLLVLNQLFGGQFTSRLNAKLREERGLTYGVRSHFDFRRGPGPFSISAAVAPDGLAQALDDLYQELSGLVRERPPTQSELDDARRALIEGHARHFETPSALVGRYAHLAIHGLAPDTESGFAGRLEQIDLDSLSATAQLHFRPEALVAVVVADADSISEDLKGIDWASIERIDD